MEYTDSVPTEIQNDIKEAINLSPDDVKPEHQWILYWKRNQAGKVHGRERPTLVYVHEVFENGCTCEDYDMLCIQRTSKNVPPGPFDESDPYFIKSFRNVMNRAEFAELRGVSDSIWLMQNMIQLTERFISELNNEYLQVREH